MGFGEFFGFNRDPQDKEGRENDGGSHQAVPNRPPEDMGFQDIENVDINKEIERIKEEIKTEEESSNPDIGKLDFLREKLEILETQQ